MILRTFVLSILALAIGIIGFFLESTIISNIGPLIIFSALVWIGWDLSGGAKLADALHAKPEGGVKE